MKKCDICSDLMGEELIHNRQLFGMLGNMSNRLLIQYDHVANKYELAHRVILRDANDKLLKEYVYTRNIKYCPMCGRELKEEP